jgi:DNA/RNA endonuclease YhcR with UshA esterase domain
VEVEVLTSLEDDVTEKKTFPYAQLLLSTSVSMERLKVNKITTTTNEDSSNKGAMTITCTASDGTTVVVRTAVLRDENGDLITSKAYSGKMLNVRGIVDYYSGSYQIKVLSASDITIVK